MKINFLILSIMAMAAFSSCKKDDVNVADTADLNGLGGDTWKPGPIDKWIFDTLTMPYNITVKYKWDQFEDLADITKILVPPKEEHIVPILSSVKKVWIDPYIAESSELFIKRLAPKFFYMIGSPAYEQNGAIKLGVAEGGRKIILLAVNFTRVKGMQGYRPQDSVWLKEMFNTINHEFGHILHQNVMYPNEFKTLNPGLYTSEWINYSDAQARRDGFISAYSMNNADDDFVEMIAFMLTEGKQGYETALAAIPDGTTDRGTTRQQAIARFRAKESLVVNYYKQVWNIDFYRLQTRTRAAIQQLIY